MFNMKLCSSGKAPIVKGDKISKGQCPQNDIERSDESISLFLSCGQPDVRSSMHTP